MFDMKSLKQRAIENDACDIDDIPGTWAEAVQYPGATEWACWHSENVIKGCWPEGELCRFVQA